jgi:hypothetical protein
MSLTGDLYNTEQSLTGNGIEDDILTSLSIENLNVSSNLNLTGNLKVNNTTITPSNLSYLSGLTQNIQTTFSNIVTNSTLANYVTNSSLTSTLLSYQLISNMSNYVTNTSLASTLTSYVSNYSLAISLSYYQTISAMSNYLTTSTASATYQTIANMNNPVNAKWYLNFFMN